MLLRYSSERCARARSYISEIFASSRSKLDKDECVIGLEQLPNKRINSTLDSRMLHSLPTNGTDRHTDASGSLPFNSSIRDAYDSCRGSISREACASLQQAVVELQRCYNARVAL